MSSLNRARFVPRPVTVRADDAERPDLWDLVDQARGGDDQAFGQFHDLTVSAVYAYVCRRLLGDRESAEEVTADVYLAAWRALDRVQRAAASPAAWLATIARRRVIDYHRARNRRPVTPAGAPSDLTAFNAELTMRPAENVCVDRDEARALWAHVLRLSADQHRVLRCRFWFGLSVEDTATALGKQPAAVKSLQYRALQNLRDQLGGTELDPDARIPAAAAA